MSTITLNNTLMSRMKIGPGFLVPGPGRWSRLLFLPIDPIVIYSMTCASYFPCSISLTHFTQFVTEIMLLKANNAECRLKLKIKFLMSYGLPHASEHLIYVRKYDITSFYDIQNQNVSNTATICSFWSTFQSFYSKLKAVYLCCRAGQFKSYLSETSQTSKKS